MSRVTDLSVMNTADIEEWDRTLRRALRLTTSMKNWLDTELTIAVNHLLEVEVIIDITKPTGQDLAAWTYRLHQAQTRVDTATQERAALDTIRPTISQREAMVERLAEELDRRRRDAVANPPNH